MLPSSSHRAAFTLIEMLTVMLVIAILAGMILGINSLAQTKAARTRAQGEIQELSLGCENYKADNGTYPRTDATDTIDARVHANPTNGKYAPASRDLYIALSGDLDCNYKVDPADGKNYLSEFFKPSVLNATKDTTTGTITLVNYLQDPFGNCYGYSTAGVATEENFIDSLRTNPKATRPSASAGYNPTFDLWSTGGAISGTGTQAKWVKNW